jgi:hypothetical protein
VELRNSAEKALPLPVYGRVRTVEKVASPKGDASTPWARFLGPDKGHIRIGRGINLNDEFNAFSEFYIIRWGMSR